VIGDLRIKFIVWWRVHISGRLHLGKFFRYVLEEDEGTPLLEEGRAECNQGKLP
jgi:hypothetical protein